MNNPPLSSLSFSLPPSSFPLLSFPPFINSNYSFAFGVVLWEILHPNTPLYPFLKKASEYQMLIATVGKRMPISTSLPLQLAELIEVKTRNKMKRSKANEDYESSCYFHYKIAIY